MKRIIGPPDFFDILPVHRPKKVENHCPREQLQNMMQSMTSYEVVYISQRDLVLSLKYVARFCLSKVKS